MARHHSPHRKESPQPSPKPPSAALQTRPFAPTPDSQDLASPHLNPASSAPTFVIADPSGTSRHPIQPKLTIGAPGDKYEQEADRVASQVVQHIHSPSPNADHAVQREAMPEEEELQMKPTGGMVTGDASPHLETEIQRAKGSGQILAPELQAKMGQAMGADFSGVRVHTNPQADHLNRSIQAKAFTTGQDIFFRQGAYQPGSQSGQELIAHELTHVVQQKGADTIQRKTTNLTPLPDDVVTKQFIGKSTTEKIQSTIGKYNAIADDNRDYDAQAKVLQEVVNHSNQWLTSYVDKKHGKVDAKKQSKVDSITQATVEAANEMQSVGKQKGATVDLPDTTGMNLASKAKSTAKTGGAGLAGILAGGLIVGVGASLAPITLIGGGVAFYKHKKSKAKKKAIQKQASSGRITFDISQDARDTAKIAKEHYKANKAFALLDDNQLYQILELTKTSEGKQWLSDASFRTPNEALAYAQGKDFKNWENEPFGFKMQVTRIQYDLELQNTPGYHKALSVLGKKQEIYQHDAEEWAKTLETPAQLSEKAKQGLQENNQEYGENSKPSFEARKGQGFLGSEKELLKSNAAAMSIMQRIFIVLQKGLSFKDDNGDFQNWTEPVAVALSHGGRVNIRIPKVDPGQDQHSFFSWLTGGRDTMETAKMHTRSAGTHRVAISKDKGEKKGSFKEKGGFLAAIQAGLGAETGDTYHYGLDLPVGGLGNLDMNGDVILPNGAYGHLYVGYKPPTTERDGGLLIGCETDAPGMTNALGHKHTAKATSADHSSTGGLKSDKIEKKKGDMMVDLSAISRAESNWMTQLQDMEQQVQQGKVTAAELVGKKQLEFLKSPEQNVEENIQTSAKAKKIMGLDGVNSREEAEELRKQAMHDAKAKLLLEQLEEAGLI